MSEHLDEQTQDQEQVAFEILLPYEVQLDRQSPEYTIHQLREKYFDHLQAEQMGLFTFGLRLLLERKYLRRLNDERLELTSAGKEWFSNRLSMQQK